MVDAVNVVDIIVDQYSDNKIRLCLALSKTNEWEPSYET